MSYRYETHLHTCQGSACASATGAEMARAHLAAGYTGIFITDHFFNGNTAVPRELPFFPRLRHALPPSFSIVSFVLYMAHDSIGGGKSPPCFSPFRLSSRPKKTVDISPRPAIIPA